MNLKLQLFNFKQKELTIDQLDESRIVQIHLDQFDNISEKELVYSLRESLVPYSYAENVKLFLEAVKQEIDSKPLVYELKDLFRKVQRKNLSELYRQPLNVILEIINQDNDDNRMEKILNELQMYDWVPEIKGFLMSMRDNPIEIQNLSGNGKGLKVFSLVEKVNEGTLAFIHDRWFLISEGEIKQVIADDYVKDEEKIRELRILEQVFYNADIDENTINFQIDENLSIGISTKKGSDILLNGEKIDKETTLETIFNSPIIPYLKRGQYIMCETCKNNIDKFIDLDIAIKIFNPINPLVEGFCFNYKDKIYLYTVDRRKGSSFYAYENASELIRDIQKDFDFDLTKFYENKLSNEVKYLKSLEDKEKAIDLKLKDINESIDLIAEQEVLLEESKELKDALNSLMANKHSLQKELNVIKDEKIKTRKTLI
jgi:hypothetical protein